MTRLPKSRTPNLSARLVGRGDDKHVLWRWNIGPALRKRGFRAIDMWADGAAFSLADSAAHGFDQLVPARHKGHRPMAHRDAAALARHLTKMAKDQARSAVAESAERAQKAFHVRTMADLIGDYTAWAHRRIETGNLSPKTFATYKSAMRTIDRWFANECPAGFRGHIIEEWHEELGQTIGPHGARATSAMLLRLLRWAGRRDDWIAFLPDTRQLTGLNLKRPGGRLRVGTPDEMAALLTAFDAEEPAMGDALVLLLWTCMRVHDALTVTPRAFENDTLVYRQGKTGTVLTIPLRHTLAARLPAMMARQRDTLKASRRDNDVRDFPLILAPDGRPYARQGQGSGISYHRPFNDRWNTLRAIAALSCPSLDGHGLNRLGEPWLAFRPQDTRDTSATRLSQAGCTDDQVASWHGSDAKTIRQLHQHYIDLCPVTAGAAGDKLEDFARKTGMVV